MEKESFLEQSVERQSLVLLLGPFFLLISLGLGLIKGALFGTLLFFLLITGLLGTLFFALQGAAVGGALILLSFLLSRSTLPQGTQLWHFGWYLSFVLGLLVTSLLLGERATVEEEKECAPPAIDTTPLEQEIERCHEEIRKMELLVRTSDREMREFFHRNEDYKLESIQLRRQIEALQKELQSAEPYPHREVEIQDIEELNDLRVSHCQLHMLLEEKEASSKKLHDELHLTKHELKLLSSRQEALLEGEFSPRNFQKLKDDYDAVFQLLEEKEEELAHLHHKRAHECEEVRDY